MPPPRKYNRLTRVISAFVGFKFYLGYLNGINNRSVILNLFQNLVIHKLEANAGSFEIQDDGYQSEFNYKLDCFGSNEPRNDGPIFPSLEGSANELRAKQRREGGGVAVPLYASEQDRGSKGVGESKPSPQPSPIGEGAFRHSEALIFKKLKQISNNTVWRVERHAPERIQPIMADRGQEVFYSEVQRFGCQDVRLFTTGIARNKLLFVRSTDNSLPSCPLDFCSSDNQPLTLTRKGRAQCASPFTLHHSLKRNAAFTLAEVLITLGIIGVVAAMTLPAVINNTQNKQLETGLKKAYSTINQALLLYQNENGVPISITELKPAELKPILMKYLKTVRDCGLGTTDVDTACIPNNKYIDAPEKQKHIYKTYNGQNDIGYYSFDDGQFVINDGMLVLINNAGGGVVQGADTNVFISVDVNGYNKRPNRLGQDLFMFQINENGTLLPMGAKGTHLYSETDQYCSTTSNNDMNGGGCTAKALSHEDFFKNLPR